MLRNILTLLFTVATAATPLCAQIPTSPAAARFEALSYWEEAQSTRITPLPASVEADGKAHTVTGLVIGAAVGLVAGYALYDIFCEAVDNRCADSRFRLLLYGGVVGGALGALIGSLAH